ncbi:MAG TPA: GWxTD domain-containing protein [Bryobacteraceae bacterium]|nr:GWxTD domain-containing protein [Bryobacteraceae bacterium]
MLRITSVLALLACSLQLVSAAKKVKLPEQYNKWLNQDVLYIITDEERKAFLALNTDDEREKFIDNFWEIRNPARGSNRNPYKDEHYERLEYANAHFGSESNTPGWMTDMGRTWILFGKPTSQHHFIGYSQIYPIELWFYENTTNSPSLPRFFYVMFYIDGGIGEYKYYKPFIDGPMKLVRGSQFNTNADVYNFLKPLGGDLAHAVLSLVPSEPVDTVNFQPDLSSDMLVARIQNFANDPFNVRRLREMRALHERVSSLFLVNQERPLDLTSLVLADPTGRYWLDYSVLIDDPKFGKPDASGSQLHLSVSYRLTTPAGDTVLEDSEDRSFPAFDESKKFQPFLIGNRLPIEPGSYKLEIQVTNRDAGQTFKGETAVTAGPTDRPSFSGPLVAGSIDRVARPNPFQPFEYFGVQFHPAPRHEVYHPEPMHLLFEIHRPAASTSGYQLEYTVANFHDTAGRRTVTDEVKPEEFKDGRLLKSKSIAINDLEDGEYRLIVNLRETGSAQVIASANLPLKIGAAQPELPLYFSADSQGLGRPGVAAYMRALEAISDKNDAEAKQYFRQALAQNPGNAFAGQYLVQLYFDSKQYAPIAELYKKLGLAAFKSSPVTLAQIALSFRQTGDAAGARNIVTAGLGYFPGNAVLTAASSTVQGSKAR